MVFIVVVGYRSMTYPWLFLIPSCGAKDINTDPFGKPNVPLVLDCAAVVCNKGNVPLVAGTADVCGAPKLKFPFKEAVDVREGMPDA